MFDASGKLPPGVLTGNWKWLGNYKECRSTSYGFRSHYCPVMWSQPAPEVCLSLYCYDFGHFVKYIRPHRSTTHVDTAYCYRPSSVVCLSVYHTSEPCKNSLADRDAVWVEDLGGPKELCITWGSRSPYGKGQFFWGKGHPIVKYRETVQSSVQKQLNRLKCHLDCGPRWAEGITN